ncbi:signal recognition particle-docking protein FtsY [Candidatus Kapabacteria bacterium]|nr:signal recognition particle-docking protein FtsY [Candidatus Kapabacteria bacterium]
MGFFDRFKKKITSTVEKATESITGSIKKTSEVLKFNRLKEGLKKTRKSFSNSILSLLGSRKIDESLLSDIEDILITSDIGVQTSEMLIGKLKERVKTEKTENSKDIYKFLKDDIHNLLIESPSKNDDADFVINKENTPKIVMMIGVNGTGKTTTIGKLANNYKEKGHSVLVAAADTFRAAANEQLKVWAERAQVEVIEGKNQADPASVVFDSVKKAIDENIDIVLIDTAGRLHNKMNLMNELEKFTRVIKKLKPTGTDEVFLVLDGTTGQNAIQQAKEFSKVASISGIVLTKLDGTAKGGVVISIANELQIPVRYIGVGEKITDLQPFDPTYFVEALFGDETGEETIIEEPTED